MINNSIFETAINDIFNCPDFTDTFIFDGKSYGCIVSTIVQKPVIIEDGYDEGASFFLITRLKEIKLKKADIIKYDNIDYKVSYTDTTSLTQNIYLKSLTSDY